MIATGRLDSLPGAAPPLDATTRDGALRLCAEMVNALSGERQIHEIYESLVGAIARHLNSAAVCCWLLDRTANVLRPAARVGCQLPFDGLNEPVPVGKTAIGEVAANRTPIVVNDMQRNPDREVREWAVQSSIVSFACLPIEASEKLYGVIAILSTREFDEASLLAIDTVRRMTAQEIERRDGHIETRRTNEFLHTFVHSAPVAVVGLDSRQTVTHWNQEAERAFGWTRDDVLGRRYTIVPTEGRAAFDEHVRSVLAGQRLKTIETCRQHADGTLVPVQTSMSPVYDEHNKIAGAIEILTDLTRQKHAEQCLRTQLAVSDALAGEWSVAEAATRAIRAVCQNLGWRCGELWLPPGENRELAQVVFHAPTGGDCERLQSVMPQNECHAGHGIIGRVISAADVWHGELSSLADSPRAALAQLDGLAAAIGVPISQNDVVRGVLAFYGNHISEPDVSLRELMSNIAKQFGQLLDREVAKTKLGAAEASLQQSQKMDAIGLLAGGVAHDFNNILSVIIAYSELGLDEIEEEHPLWEPLAEIQNAGQRAASLTRQLLAFSRKQVFNPVEVDLNRLTEEMEKMLRRLVGANIACENSLARPLYPVKADAAQLEQVLLNLVVNARDAMPNGGHIHIETRNADLGALSLPPHVSVAAGAFAVLSVTDTGCGMDEATQARIFEPFYTTKAPGKGTGMGLSTVHGIVQQSGGFITVDSEVGNGTTFAVYLPRANDLLATQQVDVQPALLPRGSETMLVVENDDTVRAVVRRVLAVRGYTVLEARHGGEAVAILKECGGAVDLVLTDIVMPVMDGITLSKQIAGSFPRVKVLFMSGFAALPSETDGQLLEGGNFLQKPFTSEALVRKVHAVLTGERTSAAQAVR